MDETYRKLAYRIYLGIFFQKDSKNSLIFPRFANTGPAGLIAFFGFQGLINTRTLIQSRVKMRFHAISELLFSIKSSESHKSLRVCGARAV